SNLNRMMDHAAEPTDAWLLYRQGRGLVEPRLLEIAARYRERVISNIALNQLGNSKPPPLVHIALDGFLAYVETVVETALPDGIERERVVAVAGPPPAATGGADGGGPRPPAGGRQPPPEQAVAAGL